MKTKKNDLGLYIHIPFCVKKCNYCDFLSAPATDLLINQYIDALLNEIRLQGIKYKEYKVKTIFIGGGTPSILDENLIDKLLKQIKKSFELSRIEEFTIECNPGTLNRKKIKIYKKYGINRVSLGLQSANDEELRMLGRIHTYEEFLETYSLLREEGILNINVDLMSALPHQNLKDWEKTLYTVAALSPEHISAYSLIIEEGTKFFQNIKDSDLPDEDEERQMYYRTKEILESTGYSRYEVSNYSKKGKECKHNSAYWTRKDYLGLGLGAASLIGNTRYSNIKDLDEYIKVVGNPGSIMVDIKTLSKKEEMEEFMFLGLRLSKGISIKDFEAKLEIDYNEVYGEITEKLITQGFMNDEKGQLSLTEKGIDLSNVVLSEFIEI